MRKHSEEFKSAINRFGRELDSKLTFGETELSNEQLNAVTPVLQSSLLKSVMKELDIDSNVDIPIGTIINYKFGVLLDSGDYEYLDFGNYIVYSSEKQEDTNSYNIVAYDVMLNSMKEYTTLKSKEILSKKFPMSVRDYLTCLCTDIGLVFASSNEEFANWDKMIEADPYENLQYTYRDILDELAQVTASNIIINDKDQVEIKYIVNTEDTIDEEYLKDINVAFGQKYGPINSIVLSRSAGADNVYLQDEQSVADNGLCELKISDNQIMNGNDRSNYLPAILEKLNGLEYYINDFSSTGVCYYEVADRYNVTIGENTYSCIMFNDEIDITQGLEETIHTDLPEQAETDYTKADKTDRRINQTTLMVDKQNQRIEGLITNIEDNTEKITQLEATTDGIKTSVSTVEKDLATTNSNLEKTNKNVDGLTAQLGGLSLSVEDLENFKDNEFLKYIKNLQDQIDGAIQFWNGSAIPTINNYPANEWTTENDRNNHRADIYTVIEDVNGELKQGKSYRFDKVGDTWQWIELTDNELSAVQALAQQALDKSNKNSDDIGVLNKKASEFEQTDSEIKASVDELNNRYEQDITIDKKVEGYPIVVENAGAYNVEELKVYGNSEQDTRSGKNLLNIDSGDTTYYGLSVKNNHDGTITINGKLQAETGSYRYNLSSSLLKNVKIGDNLALSYKEISGTVNILHSFSFILFADNSSSGLYGINNELPKIVEVTQELTENPYLWFGWTQSEGSYAEFNNYTIALQIEKGDKATDWEPYGAMPSPEFPSEIRNVEPVENLIDLSSNQNVSINGINYDFNKDGTIHAYGTATANSTLTLLYISTPGTYTLSGCPTGGSSTTYRLFYNSNTDDGNNHKFYADTGNGVTFNIEKDNYSYSSIAFQVINGATVDTIIKPQLEKGKVKHLFVPYGNWLKGKITGRNILNNISNEITFTTQIVFSDINIPAGTYKVSCGTVTHSGSNAPYIAFGHEGNLGGCNLNSNSETEVTFKEDCKEMRIYSNGWNYNASLNVSATINELMISKDGGEYEPYKEKEFLYPMSKENMFDKENYIIRSNYIAFDISKLIIGKTYTFSSNLPITFFKISTSMDGYASVQKQDNNGFKNFIFTMSKHENIPVEALQYLLLRINTLNVTDISELENYNIKIFEGTSSLPYHELPKIEDTKDDLDFISGVLNKKIGRYVITGDENWQYNGQNFFISGSNYKKAINGGTCICSHYPTKQNGNNSIWIDDSYFIVINDTRYQTANDFKQFLKDQYNNGTPVIVYYELETPEQIQLEPISVELFEGYNKITLEDKYGIVEEAEMTYLTDSKLNGQYTTKAELNLKSNEIRSEVNATYSTKTETNQAKQDAIDSANSSTDNKLKEYSKTTEMNNIIDQKITDSENSITSSLNKTITEAKTEAINSANSSTDDKLKSYSTTTEMNNAITQKITDSENSIQASVSQQIKDSEGNITKDVDGKLELYIKKGKEGKDDLISGFNLNTNEVIINSDNFKLDAKGNITANDASLHDTTATNLTINNGNITIKDDGETGGYSNLKIESNSGTSTFYSTGFNIASGQNSLGINTHRISLAGLNGLYTNKTNLRFYAEPGNMIISDGPVSSINNIIFSCNPDLINSRNILINGTPTASNHAVRLQDLDNVDKSIGTLFYDEVSTNGVYSFLSSAGSYTNYRFLFILQEATGVSTLIPVVYIQNIAQYHSLVGIDNTNHNIFTRLHFTGNGFECVRSAYALDGETLYDNPYKILIVGIK